MYTVLIEKRAYKDLERIPVKDLDRIYEAISSLEHNPRQAGSKKLKGPWDKFRIRQGDYRIVYTIDDQSNNVKVFLVRHRKDVYRDFD